jgi:putative transposase
VLTKVGPVDIDVPRDVDATFTPKIVRKRQRRLSGEISAHFAEVYGASVSKETISKITNEVLEEMTAQMNPAIMIM